MSKYKVTRNDRLSKTYYVDQEISHHGAALRVAGQVTPPGLYPYRVVDESTGKVKIIKILVRVDLAGEEDAG